MSNFPILLVDDDTLDVKAMRRAFQKAEVPNPLFFAKDGQDALDFLRHGAKYAELPTEATPRPALILLDLRMPRLDGIGFLRALRADTALASIPTVILTTAKEDGERLESYRIGAAGYIQKPNDDAGYLKVVRTILSYWEICELH